MVQRNSRIYTKTYFNASLERELSAIILVKAEPWEKIESKKYRNLLDFVLEWTAEGHNNDNSKKELGPKEEIEKGLFNHPKSVSLIIMDIN